MNDNSVKLKLPGRDEWIQVAWNSQVEIISHRVPVAPLYSYRWECDDECLGRDDVATDSPGGPARTGEGAAFSPGAQVAS